MKGALKIKLSRTSSIRIKPTLANNSSPDLSSSASGHHTLSFSIATHLGCVRFQNQVEWNGTVPHLEPILVFGCGMERNRVVPRKGIFSPYAECTHSTESVECGGTAVT